MSSTHQRLDLPLPPASTKKTKKMLTKPPLDLLIYFILFLNVPF